MELISDLLRGLFSYALYPLLVIALLAIIVNYVYRIVADGRDVYSRIRRTTGALLPVVVLIFLVLISRQEDDPAKLFLLGVPTFFFFIFGALLGLMLVEVGRKLMASGDDRGPAIYSLFLSFAGVFIIYSLMRSIFGKLNYFLFGLAVAAGLVVIFRGPPMPLRRETEVFNNPEEAEQIKNRVARLEAEHDGMRSDVDKIKKYVGELWRSKKEFEELKERIES
jgi:hypothetical protein